MKTEVQYKHESDSVLEALGIKKEFSELMKVNAEIERSIKDEKDSKTSSIIARIIETADTIEEACLIALRMGQKRGKSEGKAEAVARMMAAVMASEGIELPDISALRGHIPGMRGDEDDDDIPVGYMSAGDGKGDPMYQ